VDGFDPAAFGLHPVGAATWGGFVFLHLTPAEAVPLAAQLGPVPERLRRYPADAASGRPAPRLPGRGQLEAGRRELQRVLPLRRRPPGAVPGGAGVQGRRGRAGLGAGHPPPGGRLDVHGQRHQRPSAVPRPRRRRAHPPQGRAGLPQPDAQPLRRPRGRVHPLAARARRHQVVCELLFHPDEVARPGFDPADAADFWDLVNRQDWAMCESVQRGMGSRAYGGGWFAPMEDASLDIRRYLLERLGESVGAGRCSAWCSAWSPAPAGSGRPTAAWSRPPGAPGCSRTWPSATAPPCSTRRR
jgi:glycine betaine catabolism A